MKMMAVALAAVAAAEPNFSRIAKLEPGASVHAAAKLYGQLVERGQAMRLQFGASRSSPELGTLLAPAGTTQPSTQWNQTAVVSPVDFGADPTGSLDSSAAMSAAMNYIAKLCKMQRGHLSFNVT